MADTAPRWWSSVRVRVTAAATIVVAIVLVVVSLVLVARQRDSLLEQLDESLSAQAELIASAVERGDAVAPGDDDVLVLVLDSGGAVVESAGDREDLAELVAARSGGSDVTIDGEPFRVVTEDVDLPDGEGTVIVAGSREDVDESITELRRSLAWIVPLTVLALMIVVWVLVGRTLRPVERIRAQVAEIGMGELDRRVPVPAGGDEVARLAVTMNEMLARLEAAARRQQQFVADASHELRTPLTRMRVELEVDERDPEHADPAATRRSQLEEITGMQRMIEDLLLLARGDAGQLSTQDWQTVDLDDVVLDEIAAATTASEGVRFDPSAVSAAQVSGSRDELRRVVRNLVDNAARHARTTVAVELGERGDSAVLTVGDDGLGVPPERRALVFERFARLDEARSGDRTGLGLAIVHDIVQRHGGSVVIGEHALGGAAVTVTLPKAAGAQAGDDRVSRAVGSPADG